MPLLTADELRSSREAALYGLESTPDADALPAIAEANAVLRRHLGYRIAVDEDSVTVRSTGAHFVRVPERVRSVLRVTVNGSEVADTWAIDRGGFMLYRSSGFGLPTKQPVVVEGEFGYAATDDEFVLAKKFATLYASRVLHSTEPASYSGGLPSGQAGALLTSYSSEAASFTFYTPRGRTTGFEDLDRYLHMLPVHPDKLGSKGLRSVAMSGDKPVVGINTVHNEDAV